MKGVVFHEHGGPEVLRYEEIPTPRPAADEVLVMVHAATVNWGPDTRVRADGFGIPGLVLPHVGGADAAGEITDVGSKVEDFTVGQRVVIYPVLSCGECDLCLSGRGENYCRKWQMVGMHRWGGHAEYLTVPTRNLLHLPDSVSYEQAATLPVSYITAYHGLIRLAKVGPDDTVLVMAAGSGVGAAAIQLAKSVGATVIATSGADWKLQRALEIGADFAISYREDDWPTDVREVTGGKGVTILFDNVGETWSKSLPLVDRGGRVFCSGATAGSYVPLDLRAAYRAMLTMHFHMQGAKADLQALVDLVAGGELEPVVDSRMPLSQTVAAQEKLAAQEQFGKVVLIPDGLL